MGSSHGSSEQVEIATDPTPWLVPVVTRVVGLQPIAKAQITAVIWPTPPMPVARAGGRQPPAVAGGMCRSAFAVGQQLVERVERCQCPAVMPTETRYWVVLLSLRKGRVILGEVPCQGRR
jgi:hypothetical protein